MPSQDIVDKYEAVRTSIDKAIAASDDIEVSGDEENAELSYVRNTLSELNSNFKEEIERLEKSSEWDKFCMAFFGETNAGKSTIIDALRIVYDEETRRELIDSQREKLSEELSNEKNDYSELIDALKGLNDSLENEKRSVYKNVFLKAGFVVVGVVIGLVFGIVLF